MSRQLFGIELFSVVILIKLISEQTSFNAVWCRSVSIVAAGDRFAYGICHSMRKNVLMRNFRI